MAKKKKSRQTNSAYAVNKQQKRQAEAKAAEEQAKRAENARKSRQMGNVFLYAFLALIAVFCLYTLIRTLFFSSASIPELRTNFLFVSLVAIPYLIGTAAVLIRRLNKKRRADYSERSRKLSGLAFFLVLLAAFALFGYQMLAGRSDASARAPYPQTLAALEGTGLEVTQPEEILGFRSLLEYSQQAELGCGKSSLRLNYHEGSGFIAGKFVEQARLDYAVLAAQEKTAEGASMLRWDPAAGSEKPQAALCLRRNDTVLICELAGPEEELKAILDALEAAYLPNP